MSWPLHMPDLPRQISGHDTEPPRAHPVRIAPAPTVDGDGNGNAQDRSDDTLDSMSFTCQTCSRRKVKCDKALPTCAACKKSRLECSYVEPPPRKKKRRNSLEEIHHKLGQYEQVLRTNGLLTSDGRLTSGPGQPTPKSMTQTESNKGTPEALNPDRYEIRTSGKLFAGKGKTRYVDSNLWRSVGDEDLGDSSDEDDNYQPIIAAAVPYSQSTSDPISAALLSSGVQPKDLADFHPSQQDALRLWDFYVSNVEPIVKVFHVPTAREMVINAYKKPLSELPRNTEALLFAIYHIAVTSLPEDDCLYHFGQPRQTLFGHYDTALRHALVNAHFLRTTELPVLQAFVLYLLAYRQRADPNVFWILTGTCLRIAQRLGLHRDGEALGLPPFEVQMRRRLWWQLLPLDGLAGQLSGTGLAISVDTWDTKQPTNLNDRDFDQSTTTPLEDDDGATDMIFCLTRAQVGKWHQFVHSKIGSWGRAWQNEDMDEIERSIDDLESVIETRFLRYCEIINPIHYMTHTMARAAVASTRLRIRLPRFRNSETRDPKGRKALFDLAIKMIDYDASVYEAPALRGFQWHVKVFFQWDAMIWILHEVREGNLSVNQAKDAWERVRKVYVYHPEILKKKGALYVAVRRLTLKAWDAHLRIAAENPAYAVIQEPELVTNIRALITKTETHNAQLTPAPDSFAGSNASQYSTWVPPGANGNTIDPWNLNLTTDFNMDNLDWMFFDNMAQNHGNANGNGVPPTGGIFEPLIAG